MEQRPDGQGGIAQRAVTVNVYNNANKIANLYKGLPIGCVAYGSGSIGSASISTLLKDFRSRLRREGEERFTPREYTMQDISKGLSDFLMRQIANLGPGEAKPTLGIMVGGYSAGRSLAEAWVISIVNGVPAAPQLLRPEEDVGVNWGGEGESIARLVLGFGQNLPNVLSQVIKPTPSRADMQQLTGMLRLSLQAPLVFAPMPIQDAIDVAEWLVHTASMYSRFAPGPPSVGGPTESAAITKHEGFKWIRRKHYYESRYNPEVRNGDPGAEPEF